MEQQLPPQLQMQQPSVIPQPQIPIVSQPTFTTEFQNENPNLSPEMDGNEGVAGSEKKGSEKKAGRRKINIEFINEKSRRHITFSKRKTGIMKKAFELSTLTGTQVLLLVASETGHVYTFATPKLQPLITKPEGKQLIQTCLNAPDVPPPGYENNNQNQQNQNNNNNNNGNNNNNSRGNNQNIYSSPERTSDIDKRQSVNVKIEKTIANAIPTMNIQQNPPPPTTQHIQTLLQQQQQQQNASGGGGVSQYNSGGNDLMNTYGYAPVQMQQQQQISKLNSQTLSNTTTTTTTVNSNQSTPTIISTIPSGNVSVMNTLSSQPPSLALSTQTPPLNTGNASYLPPPFSTSPFTGSPTNSPFTSSPNSTPSNGIGGSGNNQAAFLRYTPQLQPDTTMTNLSPTKEY